MPPEIVAQRPFSITTTLAVNLLLRQSAEGRVPDISAYSRMLASHYEDDSMRENGNCVEV